MQSISPLTQEDFFRLTGLKELHGQACLDRYNCVYTTLAAVVQSCKNLPAIAFKDKSAIATNSDEINGHLTKVYAEVRKRMKANPGLDLKAAWRSLSAPAPTSAAPSPAKAPVSAPSKFGFGTAGISGTAPSSAPISFGFGKAAPTASTTPAPTTAGFSFGFGSAAAAPPPAAVASAAPVKKEVFYGPPTYNTGAFLDMPNFWEKEVVARATIFNLDNGFIAANKGLLRDRMLKWAQPCLAFYGSDIKYAPIKDRDEETARVIIKDAERTFFETEHREKFAEFLHSMFQELNTYGQSMSYLAAICNLALTERETAAILRKTAKEVLQGHWAAEAVGFASNAWVFEHILSKQQPDVAAHFKKINFWPDTYLQKIMSGLCVHVLPFNLLFDFLDRFMAEGLSFVMRFCLGITEIFRSQLIVTEEFDTLFNIMRLDRSIVTQDDVRRILAAADKIDIRDFPLSELKSEMYNEKILPRMAKAPKTLEFEPCTLCEVNKPTKYNDDLGIACEQCAQKHPDKKWEEW